MSNLDFKSQRVNYNQEPSSRSEYDDGTFGLEFFAFNDTKDKGQSLAAAIYNQSGSGMDTSGIDDVRQGVEIRTLKHVFGSNQPKIWSGNIHHFTRVTTYGQFRSWTEYQNDISYYDNVIPFNPILYIKSQNNGVDTYPYPIYFNDGPQQSEEVGVEPLTHPFRLASSVIEGAFPAHRPKGNIEDGNPTQAIPQSNNRILQFIEYAAPLTADPFLDAGQQYIGDGPIEDDIIIDGYVLFTQRLGDPFDDTEDEEIVKQLEINVATSGSLDFLMALKQLHVELDDDIRETYTQKSATAGYTVYGPEQTRYGTDSVAFVGWLRGS
jgi:hypothetical protein